MPSPCVNPVPRELVLSRRHYQSPVTPPTDFARLVIDFQSADAQNGHLDDAQITAQPIDDPRATQWFAQITPGTGIYALRNLGPGRTYIIRARRVGYHVIVDTVVTRRATTDSAVYRTYVTPSCQALISTVLPNGRSS